MLLLQQPPHEPDDEAMRAEQRRMWCLQQAMSVSLTMSARAPQQPPIDIVLTAEEMCEFVETGVARTKQNVSREKQ